MENHSQNSQLGNTSIWPFIRTLDKVLSVDYGQLSKIGIGDRSENKKGKSYKFRSLNDGFNQLYALGWELLIFTDEKEKDIFLFRRGEGFVIN